MRLRSAKALFLTFIGTALGEIRYQSGQTNAKISWSHGGDAELLLQRLDARSLPIRNGSYTHLIVRGFPVQFEDNL